MNSLDKVFNVIPFEDKEIVVETQATEKAIATPSHKAITDPSTDFGTARENLTNTVKIGSEAMQAAISIAMSAQTPDSFEALASLMKATTQAAQTLMTIHKDVNQIGKAQTQELHNHIHFEGSTKELSEILEKRKDER